MNKTEVKIPEMLFFQEGPGVRNTQYTSSGVKLLNVANLVDGKVDLSTSYRYISEDEAYGKYRHFLCDEGDFIVASSGIKVDYIDKKMGFISREMLPLCMNTSTIRFKVLDDSKLNIKYFMYFLKSTAFKKQLAKQITGSAQLNYGPSHLKQMTFPLIDIKIQNDLVQKLDSIMRIIDQKNTSLKKLDELVKARFVEMFNCDKSNIKKLSELTETITKGTTPTTAGFSFEDDGINFFKIESITDDHRINLQKVAHVNEECHSTFKRSQLKEGDVLFSIAGAIGRTAIIHDKDLPGNTNQALAIIRLKANFNVSRKYLISALESPEVVEQYRKKKRGVAQMNLSLQDIGNISIPVPNSTKQSEFEKFAQQVDKSKFTLSNELAMCNFYVRLINDSITHSRIDLRMSE